MTSPAETMRAAAKLMRERAVAATPGPWERPLDTRHKNFVMAALPDGEEGSYRSGTIPAEFASHNGPTGRYAGQRERVGVVSAAIWSSGGFMRKRSGRDLEYVAAMNPLVGAALADVLDKIAWMVETDPDMLGCDEVLKVAQAYLGEECPS